MYLMSMNVLPSFFLSDFDVLHIMYFPQPIFPALFTEKIYEEEVIHVV